MRFFFTASWSTSSAAIAQVIQLLEILVCSTLKQHHMAMCCRFIRTRSRRLKLFRIQITFSNRRGRGNCPPAQRSPPTGARGSTPTRADSPSTPPTTPAATFTAPTTPATPTRRIPPSGRRTTPHRSAHTVYDRWVPRPCGTSGRNNP